MYILGANTVYPFHELCPFEGVMCIISGANMYILGADMHILGHKLCTF